MGDLKASFFINLLTMKSGFYYGGLSGSALGFVFGIIPAIKH